MSLWFRIYDDALDDPRLQRLPASLFRAWFNVLCVASRNGGTLPELGELAFLLRARPAALSRRLDALKTAGLIEQVEGALRPVEFEKRQFVERPSDPTAAERMRRFRERAAERNNAVTTPVTNAPLEEEEEQDTESETAPAARESVIDAFEEFWHAFPTREGDNPRAPALAGFQKAIAAGADPARIVAGAKSYAASVAGRERRYVASASRWLSEERWQKTAPFPAASAPIASPKITVKRDSPAGDAWEAHRRAIEGKGYPWVNGRWYFDTEFPPAPLEQAA